MSNALQTMDNDLPAIFELAKQLVPTGMLPTWIKQPGQAVAIILAGRELGMEPMRALRSLQMVQGKVVEAADSQLGRFKAAGGKATFLRLEDTGAELKLTHPNGDEHVEMFTIAQAKAAGLTSKDIWQKYARAMLRSRVITAGLKSVGWDGTVGEYDPEEAEEIGKPALAAAPTVMQPRRLSERKPEPVVMVGDRPIHDGGELLDAIGFEPEQPYLILDPDDDIEEKLQASLDAAKEPKIDEGQRRRLFAVMREGGHSKEQVSAWLKRRGIESSKDITTTQYAMIRDRLADPTPLVS